MMRGPELLALPGVAAWASGGRTSSRATFQRDTGIATEPDAMAISQRIVRLYQYGSSAPTPRRPLRDRLRSDASRSMTSENRLPAACATPPTSTPITTSTSPSRTGLCLGLASRRAPS